MWAKFLIFSCIIFKTLKCSLKCIRLQKAVVWGGSENYLLNKNFVKKNFEFRSWSALHSDVTSDGRTSVQFHLLLKKWIWNLFQLETGQATKNGILLLLRCKKKCSISNSLELLLTSIGLDGLQLDRNCDKRFFWRSMPKRSD